jgi:hypothetical protein
MIERFIQELRTDDPGAETAALTRERLKGRFAPGSTRRMTLLGMLVGSAMGELPAAGDDTVVYASVFGEGRALEDYLASFPAASPTLFQTSIHPSGIQQGMIGRQRSVRELFPHAGGAQLVLQSLLTAMLAPGPAAVLAGGEERGTWLTESGAVSDRSFAYAVRLAREPGPRPLGRLVLANVIDSGGSSFSKHTGETPVPLKSEPAGEMAMRLKPEHTGETPMPPMPGPLAGEMAPGTLSHPAWFELLHRRRPFDGPAAQGWRLQLVWS